MSNAQGRLNGKVALVTGAGSKDGLGEAMARRFTEEGAIVHMTDIDEAGVHERAREIGGGASPHRHDVASESDWNAIVTDVMDNHGRLDILVNNAGIAVLRPLQDLALADFHRQIEVNLTSVYLGTRLGLAAMRTAGNGGSIINISSTVGYAGVAGTSPYAATKAGIRGFSRSVAMETAAEGIRVNSILPGLMMTGIQKVTMRDIPEQLEMAVASIPMRRMGDPVDIANAALFLASDEARYITGAEIIVDGGMTAQ